MASAPSNVETKLERIRNRAEFDAATSANGDFRRAVMQAFQDLPGRDVYPYHISIPGDDRVCATIGAQYIRGGSPPQRPHWLLDGRFNARDVDRDHLRAIVNYVLRSPADEQRRLRRGRRMRRGEPRPDFRLSLRSDRYSAADVIAVLRLLHELTRDDVRQWASWMTTVAGPRSTGR